MQTTTRRPLLKRPWIAPLALVTVIFLAARLPSYITFDPADSLVTPRPGFAWHYPLLVTHIMLGSVALVTCTLQLWPWLRRRHPRVHRYSGRVYVAVSIPTALAAMAIAPLGESGPNQQVAMFLGGLFWLVTTVVGYWMARRRDFRRHRVWMVRSFALVYAIVANRVWLPLCFLVFTPELYFGGHLDPAMLAQAFGVSVWLSVVVNMMLAEWWLHRTPRNTVHNGQPARPATESVTVG